MDNRHAFQILEQLGPEADRLGIKVVDAYGNSGPVSEFLPKIVRLRLTEEEREAVERAADLIDNKTCGDSSTLRGLLERLG